MTSKALVVLSGGQDSTTSLFWAKQRYDEVRAVSFNYGQRHSLELRCAAAIATVALVPHEIVDLGTEILGGRSPLTDPDAPLETYTDHDSMAATIGDRVELTFVPMRNALFLTVAANRAIVWMGDDGVSPDLVTGVCQADNANYPDCRRSFVDSQEDTIAEALGWIAGDLAIRTPLMDMTKAESIALARTLPGCMHALSLSHTCYAGVFPPCGKCHACVLRAHGFAEAGIPDPLVLRCILSGELEMPATANYEPAASMQTFVEEYGI